MQVTLIGLGGGPFDTLTQQAREVLETAPTLVQARSVSWNICRNTVREKAPAVTRSGDLGPAPSSPGGETARVVFSGDTGFYSGAKGLLPLLGAGGDTGARVLPGLSSVQLFAARLGRPWQDWRLCSAHGVELDPVAEVLQAVLPFSSRAAFSRRRVSAGDL
ncbi:MAG: SAM-dependent methyltransferase [Evtepia sp.]